MFWYWRDTKANNKFLNGLPPFSPGVYKQKKRSPFHNVYRYLKTIYQNLKTKNLYEKSTNLFNFYLLRCYPLDYVCKGTVFFETSQAFYGKSDRKRLIIDISQQFVCVHTVHFSFVHFCFSSFHVSRSKHLALLLFACRMGFLYFSETCRCHEIIRNKKP